MSALAEALERELRSFRSRLREATPRWFAAAAAPFDTRADVSFHVVRRVAVAAFSGEFPGRQIPDLPRLPDLCLADQLDVVAADLLALQARDETRDGALLVEILVHRYHLDGSRPGPTAGALAASWSGQSDLAAWQRLCELSPLRRPVGA